MSNEQEQQEDMHHCTMQGNYITVKQAIIACFLLFTAVMIPAITGLFTVIFIIISPIESDVEDLKGISRDVAEINTSIAAINQKISETIPAVYPTKTEMNKELSKKVNK